MSEAGTASRRLQGAGRSPAQAASKLFFLRVFSSRLGFAQDARAPAREGVRLRLEGEVTFGLTLDRLGGGPLGLPCPIEPVAPTTLDRALAGLIEMHGLTGDPSAGLDLPGIDAPLAELGKLLFFSKALGAELDAACASCHHPAFAGADGLALSIGPGAIDPDVVGPGRRRADGEILMHRNTPTFFNTGLFDRGLFWDSRVEQLTDDQGAPSALDSPFPGFSVTHASAQPHVLALLCKRGRPRTRDEWAAVPAAVDACVVPVLDLEEAHRHPQFRARELAEKTRNWIWRRHRRARLRYHSGYGHRHPSQGHLDL